MKAAEKAYRHLYDKGSYKPEDLEDEPYKNLIHETYSVFDKAITSDQMPAEMLRALQSDAFLFGGLKTHAHMSQAATLLVKDGKLRPFRELKEDLRKLNRQYNENHLEAEYEFAVSSSQMAANWAGLGDEDRYDIQYRTAGDERVRASHQTLDGITLPKSDAFWLSYYPPNGWRCRCTALEVRKGKYDTSDSTRSKEAGEAATTEIGSDGKNRLEIFRFNPGASEKVFPPTHPFHKVEGAGQATETLQSIDKNKKT